MSRVQIHNALPLIVEATPETRIYDNVMKAMTEAMNRQKELFLKMFEDRDTSQPRNEATGEINAGNGFGDAEVFVVTEGTRVTGKKKRRKHWGTYTKRSCCTNRRSLRVLPSQFGVSVGLSRWRWLSMPVNSMKTNGSSTPPIY